MFPTRHVMWKLPSLEMGWALLEPWPTIHAEWRYLTVRRMREMHYLSY